MTARVDVHVVTHTHWDREWYLPAGRFRQRLVEMIDDLLDDQAGKGTVLLDGQAVVLDDYLAVRPERREALARRLGEGSLEAGPWYVLADELLPTGEALVRNLLAGRRTVHSLGAQSPPVLYSPDAFGHPAALPAIAAGFGCPLVILWRGLGGEHWPAADTMRWRSPDGSEALVLHLPRSGYEFGSALPTDEKSAGAWWGSARRELAARSPTGVVLVLNGADHHIPQRDRDVALSALERVAAPDNVRRSGLKDVARAVVARSELVDLPCIEGELRDSYGYTWTLQGTFASRASQKREAAKVERLLTRAAEPWSALAGRRTLHSRAPLIDAAWRTLLLCHPHDTYCGCSIDAVARAMDARLEDAAAQALGVIEDGLLALVGHDRVAARAAPERWRNAVLVRNAAAHQRSGIAELEVATLRQHVRVGPGSAGHASGEVASTGFSLDDGRVRHQVLNRITRHDRVESPEHYPFDDLVDAYQVVAWIDQLPGYGTATIPVTSGGSVQVEREPPIVTGRGLAIENEDLRVDVDDTGVLRLTSRPSGNTISPLIRIENVGDAGDLYTHSPVEPTIAVDRPLESTLVHAGPLRAALRTTWRLDVPSHSDRAGRREPRVSLDVGITLELDAGSPTVRLDVRGLNSANDHRLRVIIASGIANSVVHADAAFGPVRREPVVASAAAVAMETPPRTAPLHRYVTVSNERRGMTLFSDGLAEYEVTPGGDVAITLVRAVGELSRSDLPERPGHAGWPVPTPDAQSHGPFHARFGIMPHGARTPPVIDAIEREADDFLVPLVGTPFRSALAHASPTLGIELEGGGLAFSTCKESEDRQWLVLRCVNLLEQPARGRWRVGLPLREAMSARLDETPLAPVAVRDGVIELDVPPRGISTVLAR